MQTAAIVLSALSIILTIALVYTVSWGFPKKPYKHQDNGAVQCTSFLLRSGVIVDVTEDAADIYDGPSLIGAPWSVLRRILLDPFPNLPVDVSQSSLTLTSQNQSKCHLHIEPLGQTVRVSLTFEQISPALLHRLFIGLRERGSFLKILDAMPDPAFRCDKNKRVIWFNRSYVQLCSDFGQTPETFTPFDLSAIHYAPPHQARACVEKDGVTRWFEIFSTPNGNDDVLVFAKKIDALVEAEVAQRNFVQTLTKTFAHLPIGLAVFDRNRQLVLFNPALVDLTNLPAEFLSTRPNLLSFFDHLRENRMIQEPKNYQTWRAQLADVVAAAKNDRYSETWNLPSGLTYKITGRPHPDGAVAFFFEDISAEISLTRRFRSELKLSQSVMDALDEGIAVFSQLGVMTFCNNAYRSIWAFDEDSAFSETNIADATSMWTLDCEPCPIWPELREYVTQLTDRAPWDAQLVRHNGDLMSCRIEPVAGGSTLIRFKVEQIVPTPDHTQNLPRIVAN